MEGEAGAASGAVPAPTITVRAYAAEWSRLRIEQGLSSAADEFARLRLHAFPLIGDLQMDEVRPASHPRPHPLASVGR